jgi:PKD repeat protein
VSLTVTDDLGATGVASQQVAVNAPPVAAFNYSATVLNVDFTDVSTDNGTIASWSWDFGDGVGSTEQNPSHTYGGAGTFSGALQRSRLRRMAERHRNVPFCSDLLFCS